MGTAHDIANDGAHRSRQSNIGHLPAAHQLDSQHDVEIAQHICCLPCSVFSFAIGRVIVLESPGKISILVFDYHRMYFFFTCLTREE